MCRFSPKEQYFPAPLPSTYRVPIKAPSVVKIRAVAAYKSRQAEQRQRDAAAAAAAAAITTTTSRDPPATPERATMSRSASNQSMSSTSSATATASASVAAAGFAPNSNPGFTSPLRSSSSMDQLLSKPAIHEDLRRELDDLGKYAQLIKKDIRTLSTIRVNVLWLLRKATYCQTLRSHKGEYGREEDA